MLPDPLPPIPDRPPDVVIPDDFRADFAALAHLVGVCMLCGAWQSARPGECVRCLSCGMGELRSLLESDLGPPGMVSSE